MSVSWLTLRLILRISLSLALCLSIVRTSEGETSSEQAAKESVLKQIAQDIRTALLKKDVLALLKYDLRGERVKGILYDSYSEDQKQLQDQRSLLYCYLFDTPCLREIASKHSGKRNPFLKKAVYDFFTKNKQTTIEILFWPPEKDYRIASVVFLKPSFRINLSEVQRKGWPLDQWAEGFVAVDFILVQDQWRYYEGIFKIAVHEGDIG